MRKNLFLTLALSLAAFVGINAQDWSITLAGQNGLPGQSVKKEGVSTFHYTSGIIKTGEAIKSLRFTVTATYNNAKAEGSDFPFFTLGELSIKKVNGEKISYTATSNACHNTLSSGQDGEGLAALSDGKYNNYFHSVWDKEAAAKVKEYHYIEMTLNASVDEFIIEWYGRPTNINNTPTTVVLTKGGVKGVPYSDRSFTNGNKIADLANTKYITMQGNAATSYNEYKQDGTIEEGNANKTGSGPMYAIYGANVAKEAEVSHVTELYPVDGKENTYNLYFPTQKTWLSKMSADNSFNGANGWQESTKNRDNAAEVTLTALANGDFEMSYYLEGHEEYEGIVYIGADPRSGKMKIFPTGHKKDLESKDYCDKFGIKCAFNWTFHKAEYTGAAWVSFFELTRLHFDAMAIKAEFGEGESIDEAITTLEEAIANKELTDAEAEEYIIMAKAMISGYLYEKFAAIWEKYSTEFSEQYSALCSETPKAGYYSLSAYTTYLQKNIIEALENILGADNADTNLYDSLSKLREILNDVDKNIEEFLKSKIELTVFPATFETPANWEQAIILNKEIEGFRLTILEAVGDYQGYPFTSFSELEVYDNENKKLALDTILVKTNSVQNGDGHGLRGALDGIDSTYYHSAYKGDSKFDPIGYVYFDITFPENKKHNVFTVKIKQRQEYSRPRRVALSQYGETVDPKEMRENKYNVEMGAQVTDVANLKDGGLYIISGNLNVKAPDNKAIPQYYSGNEPYSPSAIAAANDPCVYMFKKVGDGWNIISLYTGKYWAKPNKTNDSEAVGMTPIQNDAAVVKFANSNNEKFENTIVIYSDINEALKASWEGKEYGAEGDNTISIPEADVVAKALVYMDWGAGYNLYTRPCVSCQPGDFTHGKDQLSDELISKSAAGDYLHFNKTNGEGEWNIYEATMDGEYYVWLQGLINSLDETRLEVGKNPGCVVTDEATINAFAKSKADANTIITNEEMDKAQATVEALITVLNKLGDAETVGINADYEYRINSDITNFLKNSGNTRSIYVNDFSGNATLKWGETPDGSYGYEYIFKFEPQTLTAAQIEDFKLSEEDAKHVYLVSCSNDDEVKYFGDKDNSNNVTLTNNARFATPYVVKSIQGTAFTIYNAKISNGARELHAEGHNGGAGTEGRIIYYNVGSTNNASAWNIIIVNENEKNAIEEIIAEGDEVVSVTIYTTSGSVIPTLEKGINIVVKVYANGTIETQKVLVK